MTEPGSGWTSPSSEPAPPVHVAAPVDGVPPGYGYGPPAGAPGYPGWNWAPTPGVVPLRPLGLGELLDGALKIVRRYPKPTLGLSAAISVVVTIINVALVLALDSQISTSSTSTSDSASVQFNDSVASNLSSVPGTVVSYLAGIVLAGMLVAVVGRAVLGQSVTMGEVWSTVRPRLLALVGLSLLTGVVLALPLVLGIGAIILGGSAGVLLLLPGIAAMIYLYTRLSLAPAALVLEKVGIMAAIRRSGALVHKSWWRVFGILVLTAIISSVLGGIITLPVVFGGVLLGGTADTTPILVASQVASGLASIVVAPFSAGVHALLYVDQRMRKEGLDVALQAAAASPRP
jgi:hypothetical protein